MRNEITDRYWKEIIKSAAARDISFRLSRQEAWRVFVFQERRCALSGILLDFSSNGYRGTASLDRIDSNGPYVRKNIQWIYSPLNIMKGRHNETYFRCLCCLVASNTDKSTIIPIKKLLIN